MQASAFRSFCEQPANAALVERVQAREVARSRLAAERAAAARLRDAVLAATPDAQRAVAPFLAVPVLRRLVATLCNGATDGATDGAADGATFSDWATNPEVLRHLRLAHLALAEGRVTEEEVERIVLAHAKVRALSALRAAQCRRERATPHPNHGRPAPLLLPPSVAARARAQDPRLNPGAASFAAACRPVATLPAAALCGALNEHLAHRRAGNACYRGGRPAEALGHYAKALAVLNVVRGQSAADDREVATNRATTLWNCAAAHGALGEHGAAERRCDEGLAARPACGRLLLRRALARARRGDWAAAEADVGAARAAEPWGEGADRAAREVAALRAAAARADAAFAAAALGRPRAE